MPGRKQLALVVAAVVGYHALAGCCAHHLHAAESPGQAAAHACCDHHAHESGSGHHPSQQPLPQCDDAPCVLAAGTGGTSVAAAEHSCLDRGILSDAVPAERAHRDRLASVHAPPIEVWKVRRHLALRVLLR